ncbi:Nucleolar complex protein 2 domain-containing protein [Rozella allomycis CSF55]|uniref:Nucleolar complex protein 2 domain-containing protein n=1 Tax=Rozella allomycis (strain CSF55) TaxID=988480 RepID=A0A075B349_ROZAC|nr:Nucleolar complex protein 2 domain-containing protein [Rozella allomycis CSF55]|eukprot:EPZ35396.1 Nucleolar complex protein 2 domain-containing protein [Rozella allomycis CSF55]
MQNLKDDLNIVKEKDPEFFAFLENEDKELLGEIYNDNDEPASESEHETENDTSDENDIENDIENGDSLDNKITEGLIDEEKSVKTFCRTVSREHHPGQLSNGFARNGDYRSNPNWKVCSSTVKKFLLALTELLNNTSDESILSFILDNISSIVVFVLAFPKLLKSFLKSLLKTWSFNESTKVQLYSFVAIRNLALGAVNSPLFEAILKLAYVEFTIRVKFYNIHQADQITFVLNGLKELMLINEAKSYPLAFTCIRQLAITLRNALVESSKENQKAVVCWQFIFAAKTWALVLSDASDSPLLMELIYPLVQVLQSSIKLVYNSPKHAAYCLQITRMLIMICQRRQVYIPLGHYIFPLIQQADMNNKKSTTFKVSDFSFIIKVPKNISQSKMYKERVAFEAVDAFTAYLSSLSSLPSFYEISYPIIRELKHISKNNLKNVKVIKKIEELLKLKEEQEYQIKMRNGKELPGKEFTENYGSSPLQKFSSWVENIRQKQVKNALSLESKPSPSNKEE